MHPGRLDALHGDRLVQPQRRLRHQRQPLRQRIGVLHQLIVRHHLVDHADAQRLRRVEMVAGQAPAVGVFPSAQRGHQEARVGDVAHFWLGENRLVRRDRDVGGELVPEAAAHRPAVDRGDDRCAEPPHVLPLPDALAVALVPIADEFRDRLAGGSPPRCWPGVPCWSKPAQNAAPAPVSTTTFTRGSASASSKARCNSASRLRESAFMRSGRLRVMVAIWSATL